MKHDKRLAGSSSSSKSQGVKDQSGFKKIQQGYAPEGSKRRYEAHFTMKLTDCDGENSETDTWLDFARDCSYLTEVDHQRLAERCASVGKMLGSMLLNPEPFILRL